MFEARDEAQLDELARATWLLQEFWRELGPRAAEIECKVTAYRASLSAGTVVGGITAFTPDIPRDSDENQPARSSAVEQLADNR